jgi:hypothetical protein
MARIAAPEEMPMRGQVSMDQAGSVTLGEAIRLEKDRTRDRRRRLRTPTTSEQVPGQWALALSGGGIRSATFSLGVMQALARLDPPAPKAALSLAPAAAPAAPATSTSLLSCFDYLSTVSGGGYIGAFYCSLFVPGRRRPGSTPEQAAAEANRVLAFEPPTRMRSTAQFGGDSIFSAPTAWLRDSGRYMMPTGAGDMLYAAALAIRNWAAVQYVLATLMLAAFALLALTRSWLAHACGWIRGAEEAMLIDSLSPGQIWWSPLWALPVLVAAAWLVPFGIAFWFSYPDPGRSEADPLRPLSRASASALVISLLFLVPACAMLTTAAPFWQAVAWTAIAVGAVTLASLVAYWIQIGRSASIPTYRVAMTRRLADGLSWLIVLTVLAFADTIGQWLYLKLLDGNLRTALTPTALAAAATWLVRHLSQLFEGKDKPAWIAKISLNIVAGAAGVLLLLAIAIGWALLVQWIRWHGDMPAVAGFDDPTNLQVLGWATAIFALLALVSARFPAFINLSTLQAFYGSRLTRAYLGASNGERFKADADAAASRSVAEPLDSDQLKHSEYYGPEVLAPLHLINVTVNQTVDPAEQLVQRDRKGEPLCVLPSGFSIDGIHYRFKRDDDPSGLQEKLAIGQWIGTSGAAFTTGLGRSTSLGFSMLLGLANVRLGSWWPSGYGRDLAPRAERAFKSVLRTQTFLLYELTGRFYGLNREWQYLSDGGHFENTAMYELLRPEREVGLIVACDDGCDPGYRFGDLANLIRLARIDYRIEIEVDRDITKDPELHKVFGVPEDFDPQAAANHRCAMLLNVYRKDDAGSHGAPACRIILLKPRRLSSMSADLREYASAHPTFPQEPTADQFFDEAQWESYRRLGFEIASLVFSVRRDGTKGVGDALWRYLRQRAESE